MTAQPIPINEEVGFRYRLMATQDQLRRANTIGEAMIAKANAASLVTETKQARMSRELRDATQELLRRSEYTLGKVVRLGQKSGLVRTKDDGPMIRDGKVVAGDKLATTEIFLHRNEMTEIYAIVDNCTDEEFERALIKAKADQNLSRANLVRHVAKTMPSSVDLIPPSQDRIKIITEMAAAGHTRDAVAQRLGVHRDTVSRIAKGSGIAFPADPATKKTRRVDSARIVRETVTTVSDVLTGLALVDLSDLEQGEMEEWITSLDLSLRELRRFSNQMKGAIH